MDHRARKLFDAGVFLVGDGEEHPLEAAASLFGVINAIEFFGIISWLHIDFLEKSFLNEKFPAFSLQSGLLFGLSLCLLRFLPGKISLQYFVHKYTPFFQHSKVPVPMQAKGVIL